MNNVCLVGNLTKDVIEFEKEDSLMIAGSLAINEGESTLFVDFQAFNNTANVIRSFAKKGSKIGICGRLKDRSYTNKEGNVVKAMCVVADSVTLISTQKEKEEEQAPAPAPTPAQEPKTTKNFKKLNK